MRPARVREGMPVKIGPVVVATPLKIEQSFEADRFTYRDVPGNGMTPFVMIDHFRMTAPTFREHPHAGISAVTLVFEDSTCDMESIDALPRRARFGAGDLHWTLAGRGITHNQFPAGPGGEIHALQIFVKLPVHAKDLAPDSFRTAAADMPVRRENGVRVRVVAGAFGDAVSPAPVPQPVSMLDASTGAKGGTFDIPLPPGHNAVIIPVAGRVLPAGGTPMVRGEAVACSTGEHAGRLVLTLSARGHCVVLLGEHDPGTIVTNGPFVYDRLADLKSAEMRYLAGDFGRCPELPPR